MGVLAAIRSLVRSEEDLATLAVAYVLQTSSHARRALNSWLAIDDDVEWVEQDIISGDDDRRPRPDLVGYSSTDQVAAIEAKFEAGLTGNQPVGYLRRLAPGGHVAMLVPQRRLTYLTHEVLRRLDDEGFLSTQADEAWDVEVDEDEHRRLSFITWDDLVDLLRQATEHHDRAANDDVKQIAQLVGEIQARMYQPLSAEELSNGHCPRTIRQLLDVYSDLIDELQGRGLERYGQRNAFISGDQQFGIRAPEDELIWWVYCGLGLWERHAPTPFWFGLHFDVRTDYDHLLRPLLEGVPPRGYWIDEWNTPGVGIPLTVEDGQDRVALLDSLADQIEAWIDWGSQQL